MTTAIAVGVVLLLATLRRGLHARHRARRDSSARRHRLALHGLAEAELCELVALGLSAGMSFSQALQHAATVADPVVGRDVTVLLRRMRTGDIGSALVEHDGSLRGLAITAARSQLTGAPLLPAVEALADERIAADRARRLAAARKLPVKLAIPLALLILPGFVLLVTAPAVVTTVQRLQI